MKIVIIPKTNVFLFIEEFVFSISRSDSDIVVIDFFNIFAVRSTLSASYSTGFKCDFSIAKFISSERSPVYINTSTFSSSDPIFRIHKS